MELVTTAVFVAVMAGAMAVDIRTRRIPNVLVAGGLLAGLALQATGGWAVFGAGLAGAGLGLGAGMLLFATGGFGGGDAKLLAVVGAFLGPRGFLYALLAIALVGAVLAIGLLVRRALRGGRDEVRAAWRAGRTGLATAAAPPATVPYAVAIGLGSLAVWFGL